MRPRTRIPNPDPLFIVGLCAAAVRAVVGYSRRSGAVVWGRESQSRGRRGGWGPLGACFSRLPCRGSAPGGGRGRPQKPALQKPVGEMSYWSQKKGEILWAREKTFRTRESPGRNMARGSGEDLGGVERKLGRCTPFLEATMEAATLGVW